MANPQPVPFVQFSKELFDALLLSGMPATHKEIVLAVIRRTYGDHGQKKAPISISLLVEITGRSKGGVWKSLRCLRDEGVLVQEQAPTFTQAAIYALNKDYERWGRWSVAYSDTTADSDTTGDSMTTGDETVVPERTETVVPERTETVVPERTETVVPERTIEYKTRYKREPPLTSPPTKAAAVRAQFEAFWDMYPRKVAGADAEKSFAKALKSATVEEIMAGLAAHLPAWATFEKRFIPHASTWLNQARWQDDPPEPAAESYRPDPDAEAAYLRQRMAEVSL